jgi:hypothetical protein
MLNTNANSIQTPILPSNAPPNEKILMHKRYSNLKYLILSVTQNQTAGTSKNILKIFLKDGKFFLKTTQKDILEVQPAACAHIRHIASTPHR